MAGTTLVRCSFNR